MNKLKYFEIAKSYLLSFKNVDPVMIDRHLNEWKFRKPKTIKQLYRAFINHSQNYQNMPRSIGDIDNLAPFLFDFNHKQVVERYFSWEQLFDNIKNSGYRPPGKLDKNNNRSHWVKFCKSIFSISLYLNRFETIEEFQTYISHFLKGDNSKYSLIYELRDNLFGFGFALSCDFIKENVSPEYIKPDVHIKYIAKELRITNSDNDQIVFNDVLNYCRIIGKLPYEVDKLFWLVSSGNFYLFDIKMNSSKEEFLAIVRMKEI